jgi:hypothetical protein
LFGVSQLESGKVVIDQLWIGIISISIGAPPSTFSTSSAVGLRSGLIPLSRAWGLTVEVTLILSINLLPYIPYPFVDRRLSLEEAFTDILFNDREFV